MERKRNDAILGTSLQCGDHAQRFFNSKPDVQMGAIAIKSNLHYMRTLAAYLREQLSEGLALPDPRQLCLRLYCTVDSVPPEFHAQCSRVNLADTFAELARAGWIRNCDSRATESRYWIGEISSVLKLGANALNIPRGEIVAGQAGFSKKI